MKTERLKILLNSFYRHMREREKTELSREELDMLTDSMDFDSLKKRQESYVKRQMVALRLTEYSEDSPRWEKILHSSPMDRAIGESFAYFEDENIKVQFGGYGMDKSLLVIMEKRDLNNGAKRMHYYIFDENPLLGYYVGSNPLGTSWKKEFFEKSIQELTEAHLEKVKQN